MLSCLLKDSDTPSKLGYLCGKYPRVLPWDTGEPALTKEMEAGLLAGHGSCAGMLKGPMSPSPSLPGHQSHQVRQNYVGDDCQHDCHTGRGEVTDEALGLLGTN